MTANYLPAYHDESILSEITQFGLQRKSNPSVLIVTDAWEPQTNGVVTTLKNVRKTLKIKGHKVQMLTPRFFKRVPSLYHDIHLAIPMGVSAYIERIQPDHILIATEGPLGWAARHYCIKNNKPFTTCYTTRWPEYFKTHFKFPPLMMGYEFMKAFHVGAHATLVATQSLINELNYYGFDSRRIVKWNRGVNLNRFKPAAAPEKMTFMPELPRPFYLYVGRVSKEKNLDSFLSMDLPGSRLVVGDGPDLEELKAKYPDVYFLGAQYGEELVRTYACSDVFVFPSKSDTFGLVMLEALASGIPVVAYRVTGPKDVIQSDCKAGFLAESDEDFQIKALDAWKKLQDGTVQVSDCTQYAAQYSWHRVTDMLLEHLAPCEWKENNLIVDTISLKSRETVGY